MLGSLFPSARSAGLLTLAMGGLAAISGIFYPITHLPHWLQWVGQMFPLYWLGLGTRSALLPANLASVEIGHSWRRRFCCAGWRAASPGRAWPRAARRSCGRQRGEAAP